MSDSDNVIALPHNLITPADKSRLEHYAGHEIARGRATRFQWHHNAQGDPVFDIFSGGEHPKLLARIGHNHDAGQFYALDIRGDVLVSGTLPHIMGVLDNYFALLHGEDRGD